MTSDPAGPSGSQEPVFHLELTPEQLKVTHTALKAFMNDFGHEEHEVGELVRQVIAKFPDDDVISSINLFDKT